MKKCAYCLQVGTAKLSEGDIAAFFSTVLMLKLHLFLVNSKEKSAVQRCVCLHLTLVWIASVT